VWRKSGKQCAAGLEDLKGQKGRRGQAGGQTSFTSSPANRTLGGLSMLHRDVKITGEKGGKGAENRCHGEGGGITGF